MKIKLSEEDIIKALDETDLEFNLKVLYKVLDKMPTVYYERIILDEFFVHLCGIPFYELFDTMTEDKKYFFSKKGIEAYIKQKKISSIESAMRTCSTGTLLKKRYLLRLFSSSNEYKAPCVVFRDAGRILNGDVDGAEPVDYTESFIGIKPM